MGIVVTGRLGRQNELRALIADDHFTRYLAQPDLGPAQILQDRELNLRLGGDPADRLERGGVRVVRAV